MPDPERNEDLWEYEDVAKYLGISPETVRRWAGEKKLPVVKVGALNRFRPEDIREWVAQNAARVASAPEGDAA